MSLCSGRSGRRRLTRLAGAALAATLCLGFFGCGRTAPEGFWEPTKDDSAGIVAAIEQNKSYFKTGLAELAMVLCDSTLPGTTGAILRKELQGNPYKQRFRLDSLEHVFFTDSFQMEYKYIAGLDTLEQETTCTVTLAETIPGVLRIHAWAKSESVGVDTIIVPPSDTLLLTVFSDTMIRSSSYVEKPIVGASTDGCVLKKVDGTWQLWKMSGGGRFYAPGPEDAPYILYIRLLSSTRTDTVLLRPDTLHYGIQRLYSVDPADNQLLTFSSSDWVKASNLLTNQPDAYDYVYFNGRRYEYKDTVKFDGMTPGIYRLSLEHIPAPVLWEMQGKYVSTVWGVPIRIQ